MLLILQVYRGILAYPSDFKTPVQPPASAAVFQSFGLPAVDRTLAQPAADEASKPQNASNNS